MKKFLMIVAVAGLILPGVARAEVATAYVGTANATYAFEVQDGGNQLYYTPQPDTEYVWMENNKSSPGTVATYNGANRDGMKTYACSDVAYGLPLNTLKLAFDYYTGLDTTGYNMGSVAVNFFITDEADPKHYGIWSATSGTAHYVDTPIGSTDWVNRTLDCTSFSDTDAGFAIYEHNGFVDEYGDPYTKVTWDKIKDFKIAGFYDYQRTPQGGFEAWNQTLWSKITNVGDSGDTTLNEYGITLNWGDTVGGCYEDGCGEIGDAANRPYGQAGRLIRDYQITVGQTTYDMTFEAGVVPEPGAVMALVGMGLMLGLGVLYRRRRRNS